MGRPDGLRLGSRGRRRVRDASPRRPRRRSSGSASAQGARCRARRPPRSPGRRPPRCARRTGARVAPSQAELRARSGLARSSCSIFSPSFTAHTRATPAARGRGREQQRRPARQSAGGHRGGLARASTAISCRARAGQEGLEVRDERVRGARPRRGTPAAGKLVVSATQVMPAARAAATPGRGVLEGQARRGLARPMRARRGQEDVGVRLAARHLVAADDHGQPLGQARLRERVAHVLRRAGGRHRHRDPARGEGVEEAHEAGERARGGRATARGRGSPSPPRRRAAPPRGRARPNRSGKMSELRLPSRRARWPSSSGGSPWRAMNAAKASACSAMLSTTVPSRSKTTPRTVARIRTAPLPAARARRARARAAGPGPAAPGGSGPAPRPRGRAPAAASPCRSEGGRPGRRPAPGASSACRTAASSLARQAASSAPPSRRAAR